MQKPSSRFVAMIGFGLISVIACGGGSERMEPNTLPDGATDQGGNNPTGTGGTGGVGTGGTGGQGTGGTGGVGTGGTGGVGTGGTGGVGTGGTGGLGTGGTGGVGTGGTGGLGTGGAGGSPVVDAGVDAPESKADAVSFDRFQISTDLVRPDVVRDVAPKPDVVRPDTGPRCENVVMCRQIGIQYVAAVFEAQSCMSTAQCAHKVTSNLMCPGCQAWVTRTAELDAIKKLWDDANCEPCVWVCPKVACRPLTSGVCSDTNHCVDSMLAP